MTSKLLKIYFLLIIIILSLFCPIYAVASETESTEPSTSVTQSTESEPVTNETKPILNGFVLKNNKRYFYKNNKLVTNQKVEYNEKSYIITSKGTVYKNKVVKFQGKTYVTDKNGALYTGKDFRVVKTSDKKYHFVNKNGTLYKPKALIKIRWRAVGKNGNIKVKSDGVYKINKNKYISDKKGVIYHGKKTLIKHKGKFYCNKKGGNLYTNQYFKVNKRLCFADKNGKVTIIQKSKKLNVPLINQYPELPAGCEITSVAQIIQYSGKKVDKVKLAKEMPYSSDPYKGYRGSPFKHNGWTIYPPALKKIMIKYTGSFKDMSGCSIKEIKLQISRNKPIVVWVGNFNGWNLHAITLTGYDSEYLYYNDCLKNHKTKIEIEKFKEHWKVYGNKALSY